MFSLSLIIGIILFGMIVDAAISKARYGKVNLSRGWYLILGLALAVPLMGQPLLLFREFQNPNPNAQTLSLPLTLCFAFGCYLILRFCMTKRGKASTW